jgi:hypothetical protein
MKSVAGTEIILTVGILIAVGVSLVQLRGVFYGQQLLAQEEVVVAFARDLENIVDRAIATTGDAAFVYYPSIKKYVVDISNNVVSIRDKISNKTTSFSKSAPEIIDNYFEDCDKIFVIKTQEKIVINCRCLEIGEACKNSLLCCSGYCNETSKKCEEMPVCPKERICPGAPESKKDVLGKDCCPTNAPICTGGHCCPTGKPKWCKKPKAGEPRCMDDAEIKVDCKKLKPTIPCEDINSPSDLPSSWDWRNVDGKNWMTPVKNQGYCGSCWAFSAVGTVEGTYKIEQDDATLNPDLSEQYLVSCSGGSCQGWWQHWALDYIRSSGVSDEACFPYAGADLSCSARCGDWSSRLWRISNYNSAPSDFETKRMLVCNGPLAVDLTFLPHAVVLVGYNDMQSQWIIKNSWGVISGMRYGINHDRGYGYIPYGTLRLRHYAQGVTTPR